MGHLVVELVGEYFCHIEVPLMISIFDLFLIQFLSLLSFPITPHNYSRLP